MAIVKVINLGNDQVVRLPEECCYDEERSLVIKKCGDMVIIVPEDKVNELFGLGFGDASEDFFEAGRDQGEMTERNGL